MEPEDKDTLVYERPAANLPTRRQARWVILLLLVSLAIQVQSTYAPGLIAQAKAQWAQFRTARQARSRQRQVMSWTEPPTKVVWDEDPATASILLGRQGYQPIHVISAEHYSFLANWPFAAREIVPPPIDEWFRRSFGHPFPNRSGRIYVEPQETALVLSHGFKTSAGEDRLVLVYVKGYLMLREDSMPRLQQGFQQQVDIGTSWSASALKELSLTALSCRVNDDGTVSLLDDDTRSLLIDPPTDRREVGWTWTPPAKGKAEQIRLLDPDLFRFYAGQPNPGDASHFAIPYDLQGKHGTIHGRLKPNGNIELKPDAGTMIGNRWYPNGQ